MIQGMGEYVHALHLCQVSEQSKWASRGLLETLSEISLWPHDRLHRRGRLHCERALRLESAARPVSPEAVHPLSARVGE